MNDAILDAEHFGLDQNLGTIYWNRLSFPLYNVTLNRVCAYNTTNLVDLTEKGSGSRFS